MLIGIVTDSHDHHTNVLKAVEILKDNNVDVVLHAGDIISPFTANAFKEAAPARLIAVYGNNDGEKMHLKSTIIGMGGEIHEYSYKGELAGKSFYMTHVPDSIEEVIKSQAYDVVVYGHTHKQDIRQEGKTLVINPGELTDWITGSSSLVLLDTADMSWQVFAVS